MNDVVERVKAYFQENGGGAELARQLGTSRQRVHQWHRIPAVFVLEVERLTGISRHEQRPDVFGPPPQ